MTVKQGFKPPDRIDTQGYCHLRQGLRAFRLDRVVAVQFHQTSFVRPADFDVLAFIEESIANTPGVWVVSLICVYGYRFSFISCSNAQKLAG